MPPDPPSDTAAARMPPHPGPTVRATTPPRTEPPPAAEPTGAAVPPPRAAPTTDFAALARPLPRGSPRAWRFAALAAGNRAGALVSDGLRIGYRHGFDSGPFMAHVYANRPSGRTALGRTLDRRLLTRRTCVAFRDIRVLAEQALLEAIDAAAHAQRANPPGGPAAAARRLAAAPAAAPPSAPVVADLAAGSAPYLLRALQQRPQARAIAADRDAAALSVLAGAAREAGVADRLTLLRADAFDRDALAALDPPPDVVVELGLYGIHHDDALIERHYADLAELVGSRQIVFNVQTDNPEIEHIARVWRNADGGRCVWRLRPLEQILDYAAAAGYRPASVAADRFGIYRVVRLEEAAA